MPYFFDSYRRDPLPKPPAQQALAGTMIRLWTTFARTGDPGGGGERFRHDTVLSLSAAGWHPIDAAARHQCAFWDLRE